MFRLVKAIVLSGAVAGVALFADAPKAEAGGWGFSFYGGGPSYYGSYGGYGGGYGGGYRAYYPSYGGFYGGGYSPYRSYYGGGHHHHHHCR